MPCGLFLVIFLEVDVSLLLFFSLLSFLFYQYMLFLFAVPIWFLENSSRSITINTNNLDTFKHKTQFIFQHLVPQ